MYLYISISISRLDCSGVELKYSTILTFQTLLPLCEHLSSSTQETLGFKVWARFGCFDGLAAIRAKVQSYCHATRHSNSHSALGSKSRWCESCLGYRKHGNEEDKTGQFLKESCRKRLQNLQQLTRGEKENHRKITPR